MTLPYEKITQIPDSHPKAEPSLWNSRYREIDVNFKAIDDATIAAERELASARGNNLTLSQRLDALETKRNIPPFGTDAGSVTPPSGGGTSTGDTPLAGTEGIPLHDHDGIYSFINHEHGEYAAIDHTHSGIYATANHNHDALYSRLDHSHTGRYAAIDHAHAQGTAIGLTGTDLLLNRTRDPSGWGSTIKANTWTGSQVYLTSKVKFDKLTASNSEKMGAVLATNAPKFYGRFLWNGTKYNIDFLAGDFFAGISASSISPGTVVISLSQPINNYKMGVFAGGFDHGVRVARNDVPAGFLDYSTSSTVTLTIKKFPENISGFYSFWFCLYASMKHRFWYDGIFYSNKVV